MLMKVKQRGYSNICMALVATGLYFGLIFYLYPVCLAQDDTLYRSLIDGSYLGYGEAHVMYIKYVFAYLLTILYKMMPAIEWYGVVFVGIYIVCLFLMLYKIIEILKEKWMQLIGVTAFLALFTELFMEAIIEINFSYVAAIAGMTAAFLLIVNEDKKLKENIVIVSVMLLLSYLIRHKVGCIAIGFIGIELVYRMIWKKNDRKDILKWGMVLFLLILGINLVDWNVYHSVEREANNNLTYLYDYEGYPEYDENQDVFEKYDVSEAQYKLMTKGYNGIVEEDIKRGLYGELVSNMVEKGNTLTIVDRLKKIILAACEFYRYTNEEKSYMINIFIICGSIGSVLYYEGHKQRKKSCKIVCQYILYILMWVYLFYKGRINSHATIPLQGIMMICICAELLRIFDENDKQLSDYKVFCTLVITGSCYLFFCNYISGLSIRDNLLKQIAVTESFTGYAMNNSSNIYITDMNNHYCDNRITLFKSENPSNIVVGRGMGFFEDKMLQCGMDDSINELYKYKNLYFAIEDEDIALDVKKIFEQDGKNVQVNKVDEINTEKTSIEIYQYVLQ